MQRSVHRVVGTGSRSQAASRLGKLGFLLLVSACSASIESPDASSNGGQLGAGSPPVAGNTNTGAGGTAGSAAGGTPGAGAGPVGAGGNAGATAAGGGGGVTQEPVGPVTLLPARIRRLANAEYDSSLHKLLGTSKSPASGSDFPPDFRQSGFTSNAAQHVDSIIVRRLADAAEALAAEAKQNGTLTRLAPCTDTSQAQACARTFITTFGAKVYRRPLVDDEITALLTLYGVGADGTTYQDGVAHVLRGLLQSAGFLYLTELGNGTPGADGALTLTANEIAAALSYYLTGAPPDDAMLQKAGAGALAEPAQRESEARRLLSSEALAQETAVRVLREWLGIDRIANSSKDTLVYPQFANRKTAIVAESQDFPKAVTFQSTGSIKELLGANWTVSTGPVDMYARPGGNGPIANTTQVDRVGVLNQAAFLATYANAHESHPVLRGVAIARRLACIDIPSPTTLNIQVVPPVPDPTKSTRDRFDVHSKDAACTSCHKIIDPFGFSFEHFDGMGGFRTTENNGAQAINSAVTVAAGADFDGAFPSSNELAAALSESAAVRACFARFMFRAAAATSAEVKSEDAFLAAWKAIPAAEQGSIIETLVAYVKSPNFAQRRVQ